MKVLVFGATGFIGRTIAKELASVHEVISVGSKSGDAQVDLTDLQSVIRCLRTHEPHVIVNAAGIVDPNGDASLNVMFSSNILKAIETTNVPVQKVIILGSASEYGVVSELPVNENAPLLGTSAYARSKIEEEEYALRWSEKSGVPVIVARVFNPIGVGMANKFLLTNVFRQIHEIIEGKKKAIEVSRKDSYRDYISVTDIAKGIGCIIDKQPTFNVYNLGSGHSTSNQELIELVIKHLDVNDKISIIETGTEAEAQIASRADINRMQHDFNWSAQMTVSDTLKEIVSSEYA